MKTRQFFMICLALFIVVVGIGGAPTIRFLLNHETASNSPDSLYITGARVIPTVNVSNTIAHCDPKHISGVSLDPVRGVGAPAIKPHLCNIPTFTEQDVRQYMSTIHSFTSFRIEQTSAKFIVTRILFVTNNVANGILHADTGVSNDSLKVCYAEVYGNFTVVPPFPTKDRKLPVLHHGQMVFDGLTGNELVIGVVG